MAFKGNNWLPNLGAKGWGITIVCICFYMFYGFWNGGSNTLFSIFQSLYNPAAAAVANLQNALSAAPADQIPALQQQMQAAQQAVDPSNPWTETNMSSVMSIAGWISLIAIILFGALGRKIGARNVSAVGLVLTIVSFVLYANCDSNFAVFTVAFILFYASFSAYAIIGLGALGSSWFPHKKGVFMGFATMGLTITSAAINPIILLCVGSTDNPNLAGLNMFFYGVAVFALIVLIVDLVFVKNNPEEAGAYPDNDRSLTKEQLQKEFAAVQEYKKTSPWTTGKVLRTKQAWLIAVGWGIPMMVGAGTIALFVPTLYMGFGQSPLLGVTLLSTMWPIGLLGHYLIGVIDQYIGTKKTTIVVVVIELLACLLIFFGGKSAVCCGIAAGFLMFAISGNANVCMSMTTSVFGREDFEVAWTPIQTIYNVFNFAGVMVMSFLGTTPLGIAGRMLFGAILLVIALIPIFACSDKQIASREVSAQDAEA